MTDLAPDIAAIINAYPAPTRQGVMALRALVHRVARDIRAGPLTEALKWQQLSIASPTGTPLRIGPHKQAGFALFAHCQTRVISDYASAFPGWDRLDGNRAVLFDDMSRIEPHRLRHLITHALRYHHPAA